MDKSCFCKGCLSEDHCHSVKVEPFVYHERKKKETVNLKKTEERIRKCG